MSTYQDFIFQTAFPCLGVLTGTVMTFAPFRAVLNASRDGNLGDLNPTPWVFMLGNCSGWIAYSYLIKNLYVFLPNAPGVILAIWLNIQAIKLQYENFRSKELRDSIINALEERSAASIPKKQMEKLVENVVADTNLGDTAIIDPSTTAPLPEIMTPTDSTIASDEENGGDTFEDEDSLSDHVTFVENATELIVDYASFVWDITAQKTPAPASHELMVLSIMTFWLFLFTLVAFIPMSLGSQILVLGISVNINLIFFYGAPLSKIAEVLATKSAKGIHPPTMITNTINGTLWFIYGAAIGDGFVAVPNGLGAVMGLLQIFLFFRYREVSSPQPVVIGSPRFKLAGGKDSLPVETTPLL